MVNVDVVIVTYNRLEKLKHTLDCYDKQTVPFRSIIVVDNHSTDGTQEFLKEWAEETAPYAKYVRALPENCGGSGGFYEGQKFALTLNPDWIYVADDDAYAEPDVMERFYDFQKMHSDEKIAAICGAVHCMDRTLNVNHRSRYSISASGQYHRSSVDESEYEKDYFQFDMLSYVCAFLNAEALRQVGLVNKDYFIYYDDTEHSLRLKKWGALYCVPAIRILHDELLRKSQDVSELSWRDYYADRNEMRMLKAHHVESYYVLREYILRLVYASSRERGLTVKDKVSLEALKDAQHNRGGMHAIYRPGWNPLDEHGKMPFPWWWKLSYMRVRVRSAIKHRMQKR